MVTNKSIMGRPPGSRGPKPKESDAVKLTREALEKSQFDFAVDLGLSLSALQRCERLRRLPTNRAVMDNLRAYALQAGVTV